MAAVPVIDFSPFLSADSSIDEKRQTALALDRACRDVGFFYLSNHGIPVELMDRMVANARQFFETASEEDKTALLIKDAGTDDGDDARGLQRVHGGDKGSHEAVDFYRPVETHGPPYSTGLGENKWPSTPSDFQATAEVYTAKVLELGQAVMRAMAMALEVDESVFLSRIDKSFWNLRILGYEGRREKKKAMAGIGSHTDFGILTFLLSDSTKNALQVLDKSGEWVYADPKEGCFVCNIGDMLSEWTDGIYKSTQHRVLHDSDSMRISVPFFFEPNWDAFISPVIGNAEQREKSKGVLYRDMFIKATKYPIVA